MLHETAEGGLRGPARREENITQGEHDPAESRGGGTMEAGAKRPTSRRTKREEKKVLLLKRTDIGLVVPILALDMGWVQA